MWPVPAGYTDYLYETLGPTQRKNAVLWETLLLLLLLLLLVLVLLLSSL